MCKHVYMNAGSLKGQKKGSDPVELKLHEVEPPGVSADSLAAKALSF